MTTWAHARPDAGVVVVSGADARAYLQDMVSQDITSVSPGSGTDSLFLQPTGKMGVRFRLLTIAGDAGEEFWLVTDEEFGTPLAEMVARYVLRVDVTVTDRSADLGLLTVRGPDALDIAEKVTGSAPPAEIHAHAPWRDALVVRADWPDAPGVDVVGPTEAVEVAAGEFERAGASRIERDEFEAFRVRAGVPRMGVDLDESVIPQEASLDGPAVSFDKGCFLGQELVCRIHDRGRVNRHLRRLSISGDQPPVGASLEDGDREVGALTSVAVLPDDGAVLGLGFVRHEVEPGGEVAVRWAGGEAKALVEELPGA